MAAPEKGRAGTAAGPPAPGGISPALRERLAQAFTVLYTVQVSFREHTLAPEPFLIVGLIAATRRILVLTAGIGELAQAGGEGFVHAMLELGLLSLMALALVVALVLLRRRSSQAVAERA
jgi:hypothetical protein